MQTRKEMIAEIAELKNRIAELEGQVAMLTPSVQYYPATSGNTTYPFTITTNFPWTGDYQMPAGGSY